MPIDPVNPLGWGQKDPITSAQMNGIDQRLVRAVDGVQGGAYTAPLSFSNAKLIGSSSVDTTASVVAKGLVKGGVVEGGTFLLGTTATGGLVDGADVACNGFAGSHFHLAIASTTQATVRLTLTWSFVLANGLYLVTLDHSSLVFGHVELTWSGVGMKHRFAGGPTVDGQPSRGPCGDVWTGVAVSTTEIYWTITRALT